MQTDATFAYSDQSSETRPVLDLHLQGFALRDTVILGEIKLTLAASETLALVGPSGVGKTTLLRIIAGLEGGFQGKCDVRGRVSVVFQEPTLLPWRAALENLCVTTGIGTDQAMRALAEVGLEDRCADFPHQLSLGQQRRLSLARALAVKPDLLLLDEPFVSLDPAMADEMMRLYNKVKVAHNIATILVTHVEAEAKRLADRIITLGGTPAEITCDISNIG